jgi:hypothetical protein
MIFVDSNVPRYLIGASHPHKLNGVSKPESKLMILS